MPTLASSDTRRHVTLRRFGVAGIAAVVLATAAPVVGHADPVAQAPAPAIKPGRVVVFGSADAEKGLPTGLEAVAVAASGSASTYSSLAIRADGRVVGWGSNAYGEAAPPADLADAVAVDVTAGLGVALTARGTVVAWGDNRTGGLDVPADLGQVRDVAVAGGIGTDGPCAYGLAVKADGTVARWGQTDPAQPCFDMGLDAPADLKDVVAVDANAFGAVALKSDGTVVGWGRWFSTRWDGTAPADWTGVTEVSMGVSSLLGLREDGSILQYGVWGESGPGLAGPATTVSAGLPDLWLSPEGEIKAYRSTTVPAGTGYQAVAAGAGYGLAIAAPTPESPGGGDPQTPSGPALGFDKIQRHRDSNPAGVAEAFRYVASSDLRVRQMSVYVDKRSTARTLIVGVYTDEAGEPGQLIATGRTRDLTAGAWNTVDISRVDVEAKEAYWLSVLTPARRGTLWFRDLPDGKGGPTRTSAKTRLTGKTGLPILWRTGREFGNAPASMYLR